MSLFTRRPQVSDPVNYVTVGLNKTVLIVGLGNPGKEYDGTRHNIGFECIDYFVEKNTDMSGWVAKKDLKCLMSDGRLGEVRVITVKPTTFMNLSGEAVQAVSDFYKLHPNLTVAVHDELDIPFGQIRTRVGGSSAGHNGIKSLIDHIGEQFGRVRIGVGPKTPEQIDSADFVLGKFDKKQQEDIPALKREVNALLTEYIYGGELPADTRNFLL
ncbi:MAG TPA: aminoacyl-tRNA hydrolase [Candidatus Saccharimonadales bacterium]|nr:aminoacyl-tRNA hydrolase [Candidatus Saccharimonadales bacterium]